MKSSQLNAFFSGRILGKELSELLDEEVSTYKKVLGKRGSTIPIRFLENESVLINQVAIKTLLEGTLTGQLTNVDLAYICDCLTLGDKVEFERQDIEDVVFETADPEIKGGFKSNIELERMISNIEDPI